MEHKGTGKKYNSQTCEKERREPWPFVLYKGRRRGEGGGERIQPRARGTHSPDLKGGMGKEKKEARGHLEAGLNNR